MTFMAILLLGLIGMVLVSGLIGILAAQTFDHRRAKLVITALCVDVIAISAVAIFS